MFPSSLLSCKYRSLKRDKFPRDSGTLPVNLLEFKDTNCKFWSFPKSRGRVPVKLQASISKRKRLMRLVIPAGIVPPIGLLPSPSFCKPVDRLPMDSGQTLPKCCFLIWVDIWYYQKRY